MKNYKVCFASVFVVCILASLSSCNWQKDYTQYSATIDSLLTEVRAVNEFAGTLDQAGIEKMRDSAKSQLDYIQKNFVGEMRSDIGMAASAYKTTLKMLEKSAELVQTTKDEAPKTIEQLINLKKTIDEKATEDAVGNQIDEEYVKKALGRETEEAGKLIKAKELLIKDIETAKKRFAEESPKIQFWVDSIPEFKEPIVKK